MNREADQSFTAMISLALLTILLLGHVEQVDAAESPPPTVAIVCPADAEPPVEIAAMELASGLNHLYPDYVFRVVYGKRAARAATQVHLGTPASLPEIAKPAIDRLRGPESYVVTTAKANGHSVGLIVGDDARGVMYAVHGLLRKLGVSYTLDGDLMPEARAEPFGFEQWNLADRPLVPRRFVFNWHNFLSGCSSWNLRHWMRWISQSQKMGYNGIMVHAYGNNPMAGFTFGRVHKPVGYLSSTRIGRDWATMHVNDASRLIGGELIDWSVLGSTASVEGTYRERTWAAQQLMADVFKHAEQRGVDVIVAVDMDTDSANPQRLITRLPEHARFAIRPGADFWLPRPDTPEGFSYYKAQLSHLLRVYPTMDTFVMWFRRSRTPMMGLAAENLPEDWRKEYEAIVAEEPEVEKYPHSIGIFVLGKVAAAHQKALKELKREDVTLGLGSWGFGLQAAGDRFLPKDVALYPLDFEIQWKESRLESPGGPEGVAEVAAHRPIYPIHWANHDDCTYVGPPYPPFENFHDLLAKSKCDTAGYGVLHWTTRPLDLFFIGLSDAVWESSKNQPVKTTCRRMARGLLGQRHEDLFGDYLYQWLTGLPMIGRDTSDFFIDRELTGYDEARQSHAKRMALLKQIDPSDLTPVQRKRIDYFRGLEEFVLGIFENESHYRRALALQEEGDLAGARKAMKQINVATVIQRYADTAGLLGISRGEQGLIVSLNLRWLTHYRCLLQQLGMEPIRINFAPTSHELLAQNRGRFTYFIGRDLRMWEVRGEEETRAPAYGNLAGRVDQPPSSTDANWEIQQSGLESDQPIELRVSPMMDRKGHVVTPGKYTLTLLFGKGAGEGSNPRVFDATLHIPGTEQPRTERLTLTESTLNKTFDVELSEPGIVRVILTPVAGKAQISGLLLEPTK